MTQASIFLWMGAAIGREVGGAEVFGSSVGRESCWRGFVEFGGVVVDLAKVKEVMLLVVEVEDEEDEEDVRGAEVRRVVVVSVEDLLVSSGGSVERSRPLFLLAIAAFSYGLGKAEAVADEWRVMVLWSMKKICRWKGLAMKLCVTACQFVSSSAERVRVKCKQ